MVPSSEQTYLCRITMAFVQGKTCITGRWSIVYVVVLVFFVFGGVQDHHKGVSLLFLVRLRQTDPAIGENYGSSLEKYGQLFDFGSAL